MAGVLRISLRGLTSGNKAVVVPVVQQKCNISSKSMRGSQKLVKPAPYPYKTKGYGYFNALFDSTPSRFDENTKVSGVQPFLGSLHSTTLPFQVIVVDGPLASGKSALAKALADELEMHYVGDVTMDKMYINSYGFDMRKLDKDLPHMARTFDEKDFCRDPKNRLVANFQVEKYMLRFSEYVDALAHLLSTGQGVVIDRSVYSDYVFTEAMFKNNFISRDVRRVYNELKQNTIGELLRPHLAIYLDVPVAKTMENLKKRNNEWEAKSPALTEKFLTDMETVYKQEYLKEVSVHAEMLIYDWTEGGDVEVVVEDIERIGMWGDL